MANSIAVPGKDPGTLVIASLGKTIRLVEWREDDFFDTVETGSGALTAGTTLEVFRDIANKSLQHTNIRTSRRIPSNSEFIMYRIGVVPNQAIGNTVITDDDIIKVAYAASMTFKLNDRLIVEGPLYKFQSGYGVAGQTTRNATGIVTLGVPSAAAAPMLMVAQPVSDADDLVAQINFWNNSWLAAGASMPTLTSSVPVTVIARGFIKKPQGV